MPIRPRNAGIQGCDAATPNHTNSGHLSCCAQKALELERIHRPTCRRHDAALKAARYVNRSYPFGSTGPPLAGSADSAAEPPVSSFSQRLPR